MAIGVSFLVSLTLRVIAASGSTIELVESAPIETTPVAMRSSTVSIYRRRSSSCRFFRSSVFWLAASSTAIELNASMSDPNSSRVSGWMR